MRIREKIGVVDLQFLLIQILIKMGVATAVASALGRSREFKKLLFSTRRSVRKNLLFILFTCAPFALGVYFRCAVKNFLAADMGFEAAILVGVIGGRVAGTLGGAILALPALFWQFYPVASAAARATDDPSVNASYFAGLLHFLSTQKLAAGRLAP